MYKLKISLIQTCPYYVYVGLILFSEIHFYLISELIAILKYNTRLKYKQKFSFQNPNFLNNWSDKTRILLIQICNYNQRNILFLNKCNQKNMLLALLVQMNMCYICQSPKQSIPPILGSIVKFWLVQKYLLYSDTTWKISNFWGIVF